MDEAAQRYWEQGQMPCPACGGTGVPVVLEITDVETLEAVREGLAFGRGEEGFAGGVVVAVAFGAHALEHPQGGDLGADLGGGVPASSVGVEECAPGEVAGGLADGIGREGGVHGIPERPQP